MSSYVNLQKLNDSDDTTAWRAILDLEILNKAGKSIVSHSRQRGPLTIQAPFYPEGNTCHLYLLHPPAGIVGGDMLQFNVALKNGGTALLTTPGATKFYRTDKKYGKQQQRFKLDRDTALEWLPQETIYFPGAKARQETIVELEGEGRFIGWEVHCLGLPANDKGFGEGRAVIGFRLYRDGKPLLLESIRVAPEKNAYQSAFLRDLPVFGTMLATGADSELVTLVRERMKSNSSSSWGATQLNDVLIIRYLGSSTNEARKLFTDIWRLIRPCILGKAAAIPRIWAT